MTRRSRAAYYAGVDRPISWCDSQQGVGRCWTSGARWSKRDGKRLCKECRAKERAAERKSTPLAGPSEGATNMTTTANTANTANSANLAPVTVRVDDVRDCDTATLRETLDCVEHTLAQLQKRHTALVEELAERDATTANSSDYDDMPTPDDDPHAEFTDDGAYYPDVMTTELVADSPSGRISVMADDSDARQLLASVGITLAEGSR